MVPLLPLLLSMSLMPVKAPCHGPETAALDFWVGNWDVIWDGGKGHDRVTRSADGCQIDDSYDDGTRELPRSYAVWPIYDNGWEMQWLNHPPNKFVPSPAIYFLGKPVGRDYALEESIGSAPVYYRVLFSDIHKDSFTWRWQSAKDRLSWTDEFVARYVRSKP